MSQPIHIISLGAGVQSSTMALMAEYGELNPKPQFAVFADTGSEPDAVYRWLNWMAGELSFPIVHCESHRGTLHDNILAGDFSQIPAYKANDKGTAVPEKQQCTEHFKLRPLHKAIREHTGTARKRLAKDHFYVWKGISTDEPDRIKPSREPGETAHYPLIENSISRTDCVEWLSEKGLRAPKSACVFCPWRSDSQWEESKQQGGREWDLIVAVDRQLNEREEFLHHSLKPITEAKFNRSKDKERGNQFTNECEGMCGV